MKTKLFTLILAINVFAMMANAELLGNGRLRSIKEKQGYLNQSLESRNTQIKSQQTYNSVIDLTFGANDSVTWVDLTSSDGWWQIVAENETCVISLSNSNVVSQAAGTYTAANLEEDYSYIAIKAPTGYIQEYIRFASGSITVTVDSNDNVIVIGSLVGEDGNTISEDQDLQPGTKIFVRVPSDKVKDVSKNLALNVDATFSIYAGYIYSVDEDSQDVVTVEDQEAHILGGTVFELIGTPDTGMNTAQTIYFIGLVVLLCGVGIIYANAKPVKKQSQQ